MGRESLDGKGLDEDCSTDEMGQQEIQRFAVNVYFLEIHVR